MLPKTQPTTTLLFVRTMWDGGGGCFLGESLQKSRRGGLTELLWLLHINWAVCPGKGHIGYQIKEEVGFFDL